MNENSVRFYYYDLSKLNKEFINELKVIYRNNNIDRISLSKSKYNKILQKHAVPSGRKQLYKHMHKQMVWFINKGYKKKGYKTRVIKGDINIIIDSAIKISDNTVHRVRIPLKLEKNTLIIKSFYIMEINK